jgi:hypothetical protein
MTLSSTTQTAINLALSTLPDSQNYNPNYAAAYKAIYADISSQGGFNSGTLNWFSQAGLVNQQQVIPSAAGTYIYNYTIGAANAEGVTVTPGQLQLASNEIAKTVFQQLATNNFVFTDAPMDGVRYNFSPKSIVSDDAGAGLDYLNRVNGSTLDYAVWGGTLFARTELNDPTYFTDNGINLTPGSIDANAIIAGSNAAELSVFENPSLWWSGVKAVQYLDVPAVNTALFGAAYLGDGFTISENSNGDLTYTSTNLLGGQTTTVNSLAILTP